MPEVVIADTSCFIILSNINELELLFRVYGIIITTPEIATEFGDHLPDWVVLRSSTDLQKKQILETQIDRGEASAIALALEIPDSLIILDDLQARSLAGQLNIRVTGTMGVLIKAKLLGIIPSIKPLITKIKQTNFRITTAVELTALKMAGE